MSSETELVETGSAGDEADAARFSNHTGLKEVCSRLTGGKALQLRTTATLMEIADALNNVMGGAEGIAQEFKWAMEKAKEKGQPATVEKLLRFQTGLLKDIGDAGNKMDQKSDEELAQIMGGAIAAISREHPEVAKAIASSLAPVEVTEGR